jgi:hypothetical protein
MKRTLIALTAALFLAAVPSYSQTVDIEDLQSGAEELVETLAGSLAFNSTVGLNWSDAYIGQLIGVPPHFGVGVTVGTTTIDGGKVVSLMEDLGYELPSSLESSIPLPAMTAEARIGGFILPFDIGVKAGYLPSGTIDVEELEVDYLLAGADIRYALVKGGLVLPKVSVGLGINYMKGGLGTSVGDDLSYVYTDPYLGDDYGITATAPDVGIEWQATVIDLKAQVSKSFIIFTPYLGLGASYGMTRVGYYIESDVTYTKNGVEMTDTQELEDALDAAGVEVPDLKDTGLFYEKAFSAWGLRAFGGLSVNMLVVKLDLTGMYNFTDGQLGGSVGLRFQL